MNYNTQREKLPMPEYGRAVQDMVDYAVTIKDRQEREKCANAIIGIMGSMFPTLRDVPDFRNKLWDHLAFMSDYRLEIDYPCEITRLEKAKVEPERISYSTSDIKYRHYGSIVQEMIDVAVAMEDGEEKAQLVRLIAIQMKKDLILWNRDTVSDERIAQDIAEMSQGRLSVADGDLNVSFEQQASPQNGRQQRGKRKFRKRF